MVQWAINPIRANREKGMPISGRGNDTASLATWRLLVAKPDIELTTMSALLVSCYCLLADLEMCRCGDLLDSSRSSSIRGRGVPLPRNEKGNEQPSPATNRSSRELSIETLTFVSSRSINPSMHEQPVDNDLSGPLP